MKELEKENRRLKQMYANLLMFELLISAPKRHRRKKLSKRSRSANWPAMQEFGMREGHAGRPVQVSHCAYRYQAKGPMDEPIAQHLRQPAEKQPCWGCDKMIDYLRNEGHNWSHKRIRRVYRAMALHLKRKPKKRLPARAAQTLAMPEQRNRTWSLV